MIAQLVEHLYVKQETRGSTPGLGQHFSAIYLCLTITIDRARFIFLVTVNTFLILILICKLFLSFRIIITAVKA